MTGLLLRLAARATGVALTIKANVHGPGGGNYEPYWPAGPALDPATPGDEASPVRASAHPPLRRPVHSNPLGGENESGQEHETLRRYAQAGHDEPAEVPRPLAPLLMPVEHAPNFEQVQPSALEHRPALQVIVEEEPSAGSGPAALREPGQAPRHTDRQESQGTAGGGHESLAMPIPGAVAATAVLPTSPLQALAFVVPDTVARPPRQPKRDDRAVPLRQEMQAVPAPLLPAAPRPAAPGGIEAVPPQANARRAPPTQGWPSPRTPAAKNEATEVHIHIGRIEVTAVHEAPAARRAAAPVAEPMSLDNYLARRSRA